MGSTLRVRLLPRARGRDIDLQFLCLERFANIGGIVDKLRQVPAGHLQELLPRAFVLYHFVMNCILAAVHAVQFILHAIEVAFEKLIEWLGFIFSWQDILRTHKVLRNVFRQFAHYPVAGISSAKGALQSAFTNVENAINEWGGLPPVAGTTGSLSTSDPRPDGWSSAQAHYGINQAANNLS